MTRSVKLPLIQNVGPNQRATIRLPLGRTYNKITLFCNGNITAAFLSNIVLKVNQGEKQRWLTSAHLQARNSYNVGASSATALVLSFVEPLAKDLAGVEIGAYALTAEAGVQDAVLEFDIGNFTPSAASTIVAIAEVGPPSENRLIVRTRYQQKTLSGAVEEQIIIPSGQNGEQLKRILIYGTTALIDNIRVRRDDSDEFESITVAQNEYMQRDYGNLPQAGLVVVDFIQRNIVSDMLNTAQVMGPGGKPSLVQNLDIRMTTTGAGTFSIYTESLTLNDRP
jgi:hypothetical protein